MKDVGGARSSHFDSTFENAASGSKQASLLRARRQVDWRLGGPSVRSWDQSILVAAALGLGGGLLAGAASGSFGLADASLLSALALYAGMGAAVIFALVRSQPAGLLRFRVLDVLWGLGAGVFLRVAQGLLTHADSSTFPSVLSIDGIVGADWWLSTVVPAGVVAPVVEEFFFRGVLLVVVYVLLRRTVGSLAAAIASVLVSSGGFVLLHIIFSSTTFAGAVPTLLVGVVCSLLVVLTGRIWGAVVTHAFYNGLYLLLLIFGTALS